MNPHRFYLWLSHTLDTGEHTHTRFKILRGLLWPWPFRVSLGGGRAALHVRVVLAHRKTLCAPGQGLSLRRQPRSRTLGVCPRTLLLLATGSINTECHKSLSPRWLSS